MGIMISRTDSPLPWALVVDVAPQGGELPTAGKGLVEVLAESSLKLVLLFAWTLAAASDEAHPPQCSPSPICSPCCGRSIFCKCRSEIPFSDFHLAGREEAPTRRLGWQMPDDFTGQATDEWGDGSDVVCNKVEACVHLNALPFPVG